MAPQRTLVLIKPPISTDPDNQRMIEILDWYTDAGLRIVRIKTIDLNCDLFDQLYGEHRKKPFFPVMQKAYLGGDFIALILEGEGAVEQVRAINGATDPRKAEGGTIRKAFGNSVARADGFITPENAVQGSNSLRSAKREIRILFPKH